MDKNDIIRQLNAKVEERKKVAVQRCDLLQKAADEKRELSADETTKDNAFDADMKRMQGEIRAFQAKLAVLESDDDRHEERQERRREDEPKDERRDGRRKSSDFFDSDEYREMFCDYARGNLDYREMREKVPDGEARDYFRAMGRDGATTGDPVVPRNFMAKLVETIQQSSELVPEFQIMMIDGDQQFAVETGIGAAAYRNPGDAYPASDPALTNANVDIFNASRLVTVDDELLQDSAIDLIAYLGRKFGQSIAILLEDQSIDGTTNDAKGPASPFAGIGNVEKTSAVTVVYDDLVNVRADIKRGARAGAKWAFNSLTEAAIMKLKDSEGRPLWLPSMRDGEPGTILGHAYVVSDSLPDIAEDETPILFGPFSRYIINYVRRGMVIERSDHSAFRTGQVDFRGQLRHDFVNELPSAFSSLTLNATP